MRLKWKLFLTIVILWLLGGAGVVIHIVMQEPDEVKSLEILKTAFIILGGLGVVMPTYLNIWMSLESSAILKERTEFEKRVRTMDLMKSWESTSLLAARDFTREIKRQRDQMSAEELLKRIDTNADLERSVVMVFNYWEQVRIALKYDLVKIELIKESQGPMYLDLRKRFDPWIIRMGGEYTRDLDWLADQLK